MRSIAGWNQSLYYLSHRWYHRSQHRVSWECFIRLRLSLTQYYSQGVNWRETPQFYQQQIYWCSLGRSWVFSGGPWGRWPSILNRLAWCCGGWLRRLRIERELVRCYVASWQKSSLKSLISIWTKSYSWDWVSGTFWRFFSSSVATGTCITDMKDAY